MLKLKQSKKFNKEFLQYKRDIEKIPNETVKKECYRLLGKLIEEINYIDAVHSVINKTIDPTKIRENVERSVEIRLKLKKIIKDSKS
jgi:DNA helicase HerA-like ATPase